MIQFQPFQLLHLSETLRETGKKRTFSSSNVDGGAVLKDDSSSLHAELFSLKLVQHVVSTISRSKDSSGNAKTEKPSGFYEKVQDLWIKKFYEISGISSSSSSSNDFMNPSSYIDPRISFVFPLLKRIPGLEGHPPKKLFPKSYYLSKKEGPKIVISQIFKLKEQENDRAEEKKLNEVQVEESCQEELSDDAFSSSVSDDVIHGSLVSVGSYEILRSERSSSFRIEQFFVVEGIRYWPCHPNLSKKSRTTN
jgi:hypothetical protein